jgi:hypothetical protein
MTPDELRRRLMTDPAGEQATADAEAARAEDGDLARVVADCEAFERQLGDAMRVTPPEDLQQQLARVPFRAGRSPRSGPAPAVWLALAASLVLALAVSVFTPDSPAPAGDSRIAEHLTWHWDHDGPSVLSAALDAPARPEQVQSLLDSFGVQLAPELLADVRLSKVCPTPDGAGAHLVLATQEGPITLYYMPRTSVPDSGEAHALADGMRAWVFNVERGSIALVAEAERDLPELGQRIARQLVFPDGRSL